MKKMNKLYTLCIICIVCMLAFAGCKKDSSDDNKDNGSTNSMEPSLEVSPSPVPSPSPEASASPKPSEEPEKKDKESKGKKEVNIYGMNEETQESEPATATIEGEISAESIVQAVVDYYTKHSIEIGIYSVTQKDSTVIVSFMSDKAPIVGVGSGAEATILNSIADSLIDNVENCKSVIFRMEDGPYESGHFVFEIDEVYTKE